MTNFSKTRAEKSAEYDPVHIRYLEEQGFTYIRQATLAEDMTEHIDHFFSYNGEEVLIQFKTQFSTFRSATIQCVGYSAKINYYSFFNQTTGEYYLIKGEVIKGQLLSQRSLYDGEKTNQPFYWWSFDAIKPHAEFFVEEQQ